MEKNDLASLLRDFAQATSNSVASNAAVPVDVLAWLLRKGGVNVPPNPVMGSDWLAEKGFTREVKNKGAGLAGDIAGMVLPFAGVTKAPQIAKGLLGMGENLATPNAMKNASQRGAIVWHGSPHKFDAFDSSKIGTGEGAQAYGHGLYLADSPTVANSYIPANETGKAVIAKQLQSEIKRAARYSNEGGQEVFEMFNKGYTPQAIRNNIDNILADGNVHPAYAKKMNQAYEKGMQIYQQNPAGSLYKVDLPDEHIAKMLDWDKPLSQQAPDVQKMLEPLGYSNKEQIAKYEDDLLKALYSDKKVDLDALGQIRDPIGADIARGGGIFDGKDQVEKANRLRELGIPGIKYLDGGSRGAGQGSSNYVVFPGNERLLKILERNGESVAPKFEYPQSQALELAQQRAALPVSEGGLGLPTNNTAMDRANVMFPNETYHGTNNANFSKFDPSLSSQHNQYMAGTFTADNPALASNFGDFVMPLRQSNGIGIIDRRAARQSGDVIPELDTIHDKNAGIWVTNNPNNIRSRFAAFDPWRRNAAIAATMGVAAPDLLANPLNGENNRLIDILRNK